MVHVGILGSGPVGQTLAKGFLRLGYEVKIGTRDAGKLKDWLEGDGKGATTGSPGEAATFGDMIVLAASWNGVENILSLAGADNMAGKVLIDVTNPLDFSKGPPPRPALAYPSSAGEAVQNWVPKARVVKAFNILTASNMIDARLQEGVADLFIAGNDPAAKAEVAALASAWNWNSVNDMGDISQAYWVESLAMIWIQFGFHHNHWTHAFKLLKK